MKSSGKTADRQTHSLKGHRSSFSRAVGSKGCPGAFPAKELGAASRRSRAVLPTPVEKPGPDEVKGRFVASRSILGAGRAKIGGLGSGRNSLLVRGVSVSTFLRRLSQGLQLHSD